jgi:hypothetical protein
MTPHKDCSMETKIIPSLVPKEECVNVPKEICNLVRVNQKVLSNPVIKKWCGPANLVGSLEESSITAPSTTTPQFIGRLKGEFDQVESRMMKDKSSGAFAGLANAVGGLFWTGGQREKRISELEPEEGRGTRGPQPRSIPFYGV